MITSLYNSFLSYCHFNSSDSSTKDHPRSTTGDYNRRAVPGYIFDGTSDYDRPVLKPVAEYELEKKERIEKLKKEIEAAAEFIDDSQLAGEEEFIKSQEAKRNQFSIAAIAPLGMTPLISVYETSDGTQSPEQSYFDLDELAPPTPVFLRTDSRTSALTQTPETTATIWSRMPTSAQTIRQADIQTPQHGGLDMSPETDPRLHRNSHDMLIQTIPQSQIPLPPFKLNPTATSTQAQCNGGDASADLETASVVSNITDRFAAVDRVISDFNQIDAVVDMPFDRCITPKSSPIPDSDGTPRTRFPSDRSFIANEGLSESTDSIEIRDHTAKRRLFKADGDIAEPTDLFEFNVYDNQRTIIDDRHLYLDRELSTESNHKQAETCDLWGNILWIVTYISSCRPA